MAAIATVAGALLAVGVLVAWPPDVLPVLGIVIGLGSGPATRPTVIDRPTRLVRQGAFHAISAVMAFSLILVSVGKVGNGLSAGLVGQLVAGLAAFLAFGLAVGFLGGLAVALAIGLNSNVNHPGGLPFLVVAFLIGLIFAANSPWPRYLFAVMFLARRGELPRRPAVFLD